MKINNVTDLESLENEIMNNKRKIDFCMRQLVNTIAMAGIDSVKQNCEGYEVTIKMISGIDKEISSGT